MSLDLNATATALKKVLLEWAEVDLTPDEWRDVAAEFIAEVGETPSAPVVGPTPRFIPEDAFQLLMRQLYRDMSDLYYHGSTRGQSERIHLGMVNHRFDPAAFVQPLINKHTTLNTISGV